MPDVNCLTDYEKNFLLNHGEPVLRKMMSGDELKLAIDLHKRGFLEKGKSDDKYHNVIFYTSVEILKKL